MAWNKWEARKGRIESREPLPAFGYCSSMPVRPCVISFNLRADGGMIINLLTRSSQDFYIRTRHETDEYIYECKSAGWNSAYVSCTGKALPVGGTYSFLVVSKEENITLAEGSLPIIGMALATPDVYFTPTPILFNHLPR
jgi:hypothetical protein